MKKTLLVLASLFMTMGSFADEVTFDFVANGLNMFEGITSPSNSESTAGDITAVKTATIDGVTLTVNPATGQWPNRLWKWDDGAQLRVYDGDVTISATKNIKSIQFVQPSAASAQKWTAPTVSAGSISGDVWTGDAATVTFTFSKQCRMNAIKVVYGEGGGTVTPDPTPSIENTPETAYTTAKALELIAAGEGLDAKVYVKGKISSIKEVSTQFGNATFNISDDGQATNELVIFRSRNLNNEKFTAEDAIKVGDDVIMYGKLVNYEDKEGNKTPEMSSCYIYKLNDVTAISGVAANKFDANAPIFNLAGQRVTKTAKGILIQNGKKFVK